jgi:hypothetical protein
MEAVGSFLFVKPSEGSCRAAPALPAKTFQIVGPLDRYFDKIGALKLSIPTERASGFAGLCYSFSLKQYDRIKKCILEAEADQPLLNEISEASRNINSHLLMLVPLREQFEKMRN